MNNITKRIILRLLPKGTRRGQIIRNLVFLPIPQSIRRNFKEIDETELAKLESSVRKNYIRDSAFLETPEGKRALDDQLFNRVNAARNTFVPWLYSYMQLDGAKILEIGCGTGSDTITLAEQGAEVIGVDVEDNAIKVAQDRCDLYGVNATLVKCNATEVHRLFKDHYFNLIIFYASLEHMTLQERSVAMFTTWNMLEQGQLWCVARCPNRLWYSDNHTAKMEFFHWLPDELAFHYSRYSARHGFKDKFREMSDEAMLSFLRQGRSVSFHEFDMFISTSNQLDILSSMGVFIRSKNLVARTKWLVSSDRKYESFISKLRPDIHRGFFQPSLDLLIRKN